MICCKGRDKVIKEPWVVAIRIFDFHVNHHAKNYSTNCGKRKMKKYCIARLTFFFNHRECGLLIDGKTIVH